MLEGRISTFLCTWVYAHIRDNLRFLRTWI